MDNNHVEMGNYQFVPKPFERHRSLAVTSIILGSVSSVCCMSTGIGVVPALIGAAFGIIAIVSGSRKARHLGIIGLVLSAIGLVLNAIVLIWAISVINWDNMTWDNLLAATSVDRNNPEEVMQWFKQFLKIDIPSLTQ